MNNAGGILAQRLTLAAVIIPPLFCWVILLGYRYKVYTAELAICLLEIINVIVFSALIWSNAKFLGMVDRQIHQAEVYLKKANKYLENRVKNKTQQLEQTLFELRNTQTQLVQTEKMSSLGQLVAGFAHEINNPMNFIYGNLIYVAEYTEAILGLTELYQQHYPESVPEIEAEIEDIDLEFIPEDLPRMIRSMKVGADRIKEIVKSLRNFSRMDQPGVKTVDISEPGQGAKFEIILPLKVVDRAKINQADAIAHQRQIHEQVRQVG